MEAPIDKRVSDELRNEYNQAFLTWVTEVKLLHASCADSGHPPADIQTLKDRTKRAEFVYRERRNLLLRQMAEEA